MSPSAPLNPRKMPKQARSRVTYDTIVEAGTQVLARNGLAGFTTNLVAQRAGVSIGSLYQYFPNKDALMVAIIAAQQDRQSETITDAAASMAHVSLPDAVRQLVRAAMHHHITNPLLATAIDHEEARLPIGPLLTSYLARNARTLDPLLHHFRNEITLQLGDSASQTLPHMVRAIVDFWSNQNPPQLQQAEDEATRAVLGYLTYPNPKRGEK
jgi:AcrR family transcriptional regulator